MKFAKKIYTHLMLAHIAATNVLAADNSLLDPAVAKVNQVNEMLATKLAGAITALALILVGLGLLKGYYKKERAYQIGAGVLLIGSAVSISTWLYEK